ncbi:MULTISPECIES: molybdopterin-dependent oxidoreductase [unclassified Rhodococcus (in: high G+C Gram-positive bacteria)]|uniref:molybdopterin-containing oxidoreductase family protein n=1 Tax=unclassified Rhodococcus (in: high G+C Gram-positive bacteria) TaxID=192944 RepID=UPI00163997C6|nr:MULTISPECIES: molybdopterin-dependent oxidoreductase [unclassified Rhodococcus (in: high G+C Gram-positive bacteria)]MBC2639478.1 molybdopterin-dependent oxidoreductase [Rhodococcus sp. 3A]MBC2895777.1 molybdopterin-dependent oxidoreductase [Rhodococcus sp. 4CII]
MRPVTSRCTSYCRLCASSCGVLLDVEDGRIARVLGDAHHPISGGYTCPKGRRGGDLVHGPDRLTTSMRRTAAGTHEPVPVAAAVTEIAARLRAIVDRHGPDAVALFMGTQQNFAALTPPMARAWFRGTGSHKLFSTMTIDQSAKWVVAERMGTYLGGRQRFEDADVWLLAGTNPVVSGNGGDGDGAVVQNPSVTLRAARERGLRLIVVDPRRTETAALADVHLAPRPGTDAVLFAGLLHVVLTEHRHDADFCRRYTADLASLVDAVSDVTPAVVQRICGVPADRVRDAARVFAGGSRGMATSGTGLCMGPHSNLAEHLVAALNVVCGRYLREGERADDRAVLTLHQAARAEIAPPTRAYERGFRSRIGDVRAIRGELPSGILADEILEPGPDRVRALIVSGGNPAAALPDRGKALRALRSLDLLVCVDPRMSDTARLADYVIAPTTMYERADHTAIMEPFFPRPFAQFTPAVVAPPPGVVDDWRFFLDLAAASRQPVKFAGRILDPGAPLTSEELLAMTAERGRVPFADLVAARHGHLAGDSGAVVGPATEEGAGHRLALMPDDVRAELRAALTDTAVTEQFPLLLTVRRIREAVNSTGTRVPGLVPGGTNPAGLHPDDLAGLGIADGQVVTLRSVSGRLRATVRADATLARGTVSMTHCFGSVDPRGDVGVNVNALTGTGDGVQTINAMPTMTAVPVTVERAAPEEDV